jgi:hypothetical protein
MHTHNAQDARASCNLQNYKEHVILFSHAGFYKLTLRLPFYKGERTGIWEMVDKNKVLRRERHINSLTAEHSRFKGFAFAASGSQLRWNTFFTHSIGL